MIGQKGGENMELFTAGIAPGGLTSGPEIRIFICYLLNSVKKPLSPTQINDVVRRDELVNYFELKNCIAELVESGHIVPDGEDRGEPCYVVTDLGVKTAETFEKKIPKSVRVKGLRAATQLLARAERDRFAKFEATPCEDGGYTANLRLLDTDEELMNLSVYLPDHAQTEAVKRTFLNDPGLFYKGVLALLTGDMKAVGELVPSKEAELYYEEDDLD